MTSSRSWMNRRTCRALRSLGEFRTDLVQNRLFRQLVYGRSVAGKKSAGGEESNVEGTSGGRDEVVMWALPARMLIPYCTARPVPSDATLPALLPTEQVTLCSQPTV